MMQEVELALDTANQAQQAWSKQTVRFRLRSIAKVAELLARDFQQIVEQVPRPNASAADIIASEILPLADACRYTAKVGRGVLAPKYYSIREGAWWIGRIGVQVRPEPWGTILILAPSNYPLFLPGVQIIQAVAAGNAVLVKPAPGCEQALVKFRDCLIEAGVPAELLQMLPSGIEAGQEAIKQGVDKVFLTGSIHTGRAVLRNLAESLTPATMELSGCDAVFVLPDANLERLAATLLYALRLNGGATCIAPRRVFVSRKQEPELISLLLRGLQANAANSPADAQAAKNPNSKNPNSKKLASAPSSQATQYHVQAAAMSAMRRAVEQALANGAELVFGELPQDAKSNRTGPIILRSVEPHMDVARTDLFAPILSLIQAEDITAAIDADRICPYSLGASVFGSRTFAEHWAKEIEAGCVVVNDVVVPTADPRVSFGGRDHSGWGVTRGREGLAEMTRPKTICTRAGNWLPHLDESLGGDEAMIGNMLQLWHAGSWRKRFSALRDIITAARAVKTEQRAKKH